MLQEALVDAEVVVIGAGAGLSISAGFLYTGERFDKYFYDFSQTYHFKDMYSGGFYPYKTLEEHWAYWSRYIYINRYMNAPKPVYHELYQLVKAKEYFVLTTNVDHCFQKVGFDKQRLFYTQGDYGLFQCSVPCHQNTYDNEEVVRKMIEAQGYVLMEHGEPVVPEGVTLKMEIPKDLVPCCPICQKPMAMNLRADSTFVEDAGWHRGAERYQNFLNQHSEDKVLFLELGVGYNTPGIIKFNFWHMVHEWKNAVYICLNTKEDDVPEEIRERSICLAEDIGEVLKQL